MEEISIDPCRCYAHSEGNRSPLRKVQREGRGMAEMPVPQGAAGIMKATRRRTGESVLTKTRSWE